MSNSTKSLNLNICNFSVFCYFHYYQIHTIFHFFPFSVFITVSNTEKNEKFRINYQSWLGLEKHNRKKYILLQKVDGYMLTYFQHRMTLYYSYNNFRVYFKARTGLLGLELNWLNSSKYRLKNNVLLHPLLFLFIIEEEEEEEVKCYLLFREVYDLKEISF